MEGQSLSGELPQEASADAPQEPALWHGTAQGARDTQRRRRLLEAALAPYGTDGYRATPVQAVCHLAKVSTRSFYELYADHGELLLHLYQDLMDEIFEAIGSVRPAPDDDVFDAAKVLVGALLGSMLADERKARILEVEVVGVSARLEQQRAVLNRKLVAEMDSVMADFVAAGFMPERPGGHTSAMLLGGLTEALMQRGQAQAQQRPATPEFIAELAQVAVRMMGVAPA